MRDTDIVVVGAGIVGAWIAAKLAVEAPQASIQVIDRGEVAAGATAYSAGLHMPYGRNAQVRQLAAESSIEFRRLEGRTPLYPVWPVRLMVHVQGSSWSSHVIDFCAKPQAAKPAWGSLGPAPVSLDTYLVDHAHFADVGGLALRLLADAGPAATVATGRRMVAVEGPVGSPRVLLADGGRIEAGLVVAAPGPWATALEFKAFGLSDGVRIKKVVAMTLDAPPAPDDPAIFFVEDDAFLLPRRDLGCWLFSYTCQTWDVAPDEAPGLKLEDVSAASAVLARHRPDLVSRLSGARVFCDAFAPERAPRVGLSPARADVVMVAACGGSGHRLAPALAGRAATLAASILQREQFA